MNKKLLTLAIGAALASAPMFANAALTAYGKLNVGIAVAIDKALSSDRATKSW